MTAATTTTMAPPRLLPSPFPRWPRPPCLLPPFHVVRSRDLGPPVLGSVTRGALKTLCVRTTTIPTGRETVESPTHRGRRVHGTSPSSLPSSPHPFLPPPLPVRGSSRFPSLGIGLGVVVDPLYRWPTACSACKIPPPTPQSIPPGAGSGVGQEGQRTSPRRNQTQTQTSVPLVLACADCPYLDSPAFP